jgi:Beta-propeller repeat
MASAHRSGKQMSSALWRTIAAAALIGVAGCSSRTLSTSESGQLTSVGGDDSDRGYDVAVDADGNAFVTGFFQGQVTVDGATIASNGNNDILVGKFAPDGEVLWVTSAGGPGLDSGRSIAVDAGGNALVTGSFDKQAVFGNATLSSNGDDDAFVAKLSPGGQVLWAVSLGGPGYDLGHGIAVDASGDVYVTGLFNDQAAFGNTVLASGGSHDVFLAKLSPDGQVLWATRVGGPGRDIGYAIVLDAARNIYITGSVDPQATFGATTLSSNGHWDIFVAKFSPAGQVLWATSAGGPSDNDGGTDIAVDDGGNVVVIGRFEDQAVLGAATLTSSGKEDTLVVKLSSDGNLLWSTTFGGSDRELGHALVTGTGGTIYLTGFFDGGTTFGSTTLTAGGDGDLFVARLSPDGQLLEGTSAGGTGRCTGNGIAMDADGRLLVVGAFHGTATFGDTQRLAAGNDDVFLWKLDPP